MGIDATAETLRDHISRGNVLLDVWGPQCAPCLALMPAVEVLEERFRGSISLVKLNATENRKICRELRIASLPTYVTFREGTEVERLVGTVTIEGIQAAIQRLLEGAPAKGLPIPEHLRGGGETT